MKSLKKIFVTFVFLYAGILFADEGNVTSLFKAPRIKLKPYKLTLEFDKPYLLAVIFDTNKITD